MYSFSPASGRIARLRERHRNPPFVPDAERVEDDGIARTENRL